MSCRVDKRSRRRGEEKGKEKCKGGERTEGKKRKEKGHEDRQQSRTKIIHTEKPKLFINVPSKESLLKKVYPSAPPHLPHCWLHNH